MDPAAADRFDANYKTPEILADHLSKKILENILHSRQELAGVLQELRRDHPEAGLGVEYLLDSIYGYADARRDLDLSASKDHPK